MHKIIKIEGSQKQEKIKTKYSPTPNNERKVKKSTASSKIKHEKDTRRSFAKNTTGRESKWIL